MAQTDAPQIYGLTQQQKADLLAGQDKIAVNSPIVQTGDCSGPQQVHGEVGAMVGTGGARGAFGTAAIPLGCKAGAVVSFESDRSGYRRHR